MSITAIVLLVSKGLIVTGVALAVVLILVGIAINAYTSRKLKQRFAVEYDRAVRESGSKWRVESKLKKIESRRERLQIRSLSPAEQARFEDSWRTVQSRFVDSPETALSDADSLVEEVMTARGYPVHNFNEAAEDISADHPLVVEHYQAGHAIAVRHAAGGASTEEIRQAMIHYRTLFNELLGTRGAEQPAARRATA